MKKDAKGYRRHDNGSNLCLEQELHLPGERLSENFFDGITKPEPTELSGYANFPGL